MQQSEINTAIERFAKELQGNIGASLEAVVVYGSLVKGDYNPTTSDHNVALVLKNDSASTLRGIAATMRKARPSKKTGLLLLTREEIANARDVFSLKFRDISRHHQVIVGDGTLLDGMAFSKSHLALDCEHQLRGLVVRLRRLFIRGENAPKELRTNLVGSFKAFLPPMGGLVDLLGQGTPSTKKEIVEASAAALDTDTGALSKLLQMSSDPTMQPSTTEIDSLLDGYTKILKTAAGKADGVGASS